MKSDLIIKWLFGILLSFIIISCSEEDTIPVTPEPVPDEDYQYTIPIQTDDGWETASVENVGMVLQPLVDMVNYVDSTNGHQIHNILIFKDNKLAFEKYFQALEYQTSPPGNGNNMVTYDKNMLHYLASGSKSVTSVLFGAAIKQGFIDADVNIKISEYLPVYSSILSGDKAGITIKHLLTMTSGLDFDENTYPYGDNRNDVTRLFYEYDPIRFVLSKSMHAPPGTVFHYNSGVTNVIGDIIRLESNRSLLTFASEYLFGPLGITEYEWQRISGAYYFASGGLSLRPRDMAKIGALFLNNGEWNGQQIITPEWIQASIQSYTTPDMNITSGYGYQWWVDVDGFFMSAGYGGQYMIISPQINVIVVFNCGYFDKPETVSPFELINSYIVDSVFPGG